MALIRKRKNLNLKKSQSGDENKQDQGNLRFVSNDRNKEQILSDYEKPIVSYPAITSSESSSGEDGLIYRDGIETPLLVELSIALRMVRWKWTHLTLKGNPMEPS